MEEAAKFHPEESTQLRNRVVSEIQGLSKRHDSIATTDVGYATTDVGHELPIKVGDLKKTSRSLTPKAGVDITRERRFQLTKVAIEYLQRFSQVKIRRSFPLTSIREVIYAKDKNPLSFQLVFSTNIMILEANSAEDANDWVEKISEVWRDWHTVPNPADSLLCGSMEAKIPLVQDDDDIIESIPEAGHPDDGIQTESFKSASTRKKHHWRRGLIKRKMHVPQFERMADVTYEGQSALKKLHHESAMIKYPHKKWSLPHERLVKIDKDDLQIMWRHSGGNYHMSNTLPLGSVWEFREGHWTKGFHNFPYEEVEGQSFSLIYEEEKGGGRYVGLTSLDVICDHPDHYKDWITGLTSLISGPARSIWNVNYPKTDPSILWLKCIWTVNSSNHEITERVAASLLSKIHPSCDPQLARLIILTSHDYQCGSTQSRGLALLWDGFTLLFNLLCENGRLNHLFRQYAIKYPNLGLTKEEFADFLIEECDWRRGDCTRDSVQKLIKHHDRHHQAFKKYAAKNRPFEFSISTSKPLLSYAGMLSFLRSRDNSAIQEDLFQDMDQPLSHYFINSSHNTYLEGDQVKGVSSLEAYIHVLLQACRCIEIDCWDDSLRVGGGGIIVYHGYTFTTKLEFKAVIATIREYAFRSSVYPLTISIENHCSPSNQKEMARCFLDIMGDVLCRENLVETQGRERLPSPNELQGKIILKGTFNRAKETMLKTASEHSLSKALVKGTSLAAINMEEQMLDDKKTIEQTFGAEAAKIVAKIAEQDDQETTFVEDTAEDLRNLVVYCRSISIKPWNWEVQKKKSVCEMFSFGEPSAIKHCKSSSEEMVVCTERQLVRVYPKGRRMDSSNYDPTLMWSCGVQMVALNFQTPDEWMHLNQGFFRQNGGCGYVLKPDVMRRQHENGYSPFMTEPHPDVPPVDLELELISGEQLCPYKKKCASLTVEISAHGIPHDTSKLLQASHTSSFWPQWENIGAKISIFMPQLCLIYFRVVVQYKLGNPRLYGQNCIPLTMLQSGLKFIPLRTFGGDLIPQSGLFVRIKKNTQVTTTMHHRSSRLVHQTSIHEDTIEFS